MGGRVWIGQLKQVHFQFGQEGSPGQSVEARCVMTCWLAQLRWEGVPNARC